MAKFIIIGGDGFVGRYLAEKLINGGQEVLVLDIKKTPMAIYDKCQFQYTDIRNVEQLREIAFAKDDIVIHLAANQYHEKVPRKNRKAYFFDTNCAGTENVLCVMAEKGCDKVVYFSTDMTYGRPQYLPVDTLHPQVPFGFYGASKKESEGICKNYRAKGFNITIFRPRMILGPGRLGVLEKLFKLMDHNLPIPLIGQGRNCYQMISVFDCVDAILKCIDKGIPNEEYNLGSDNPPCVYDLLMKAVKNAGSRSCLVRTNGWLVKTALAALGGLGVELLYKEQYEIADENYIVDISKTTQDLGWKPLFSDGDMLVQAYDYYKKRSEPLEA